VATHTARKRARGVTRTLRIDAEVDEALRAWSSREGVSISSFANRALRKHVEWDVYADRFGFVSVPEDALARMTAQLSEEQAREVGTWMAENVGPALVNFWFSKASAQEVVHTLPRLLSRYARLYEFEEREDTDRIVQVFKHSGGRPTSALLEALWRTMYRVVVPAAIETEIMDEAVVVSFDKAQVRGPIRRSRNGALADHVPA
jgi:hypothetical protein